MDDGQTYGKKLSHKNKTLTSNLQQPAQETNPLSTVTSSESQTTVDKLHVEVRPLFLATRPGSQTITPKMIGQNLITI